MKWAYVREKYNIDDTDIQKKTIEAYVEVDRWVYEDTQTKYSRRDEMLDEINNKDEAYVFDLVAFSNNIKELANLVDRIHDKGGYLIVIRDSIDGRTDQGKNALITIKKVNNYISEASSELQRQGIDEAKKEKRYKGRKRIEIDEYKLAKTWYDYNRGRNIEQCAKEMGMSIRTLQRHFYRKNIGKIPLYYSDYGYEAYKIRERAIKDSLEKAFSEEVAKRVMQENSS